MWDYMFDIDRAWSISGSSVSKGRGDPLPSLPLSDSELDLTILLLYKCISVRRNFLSSYTKAKKSVETLIPMNYKFHSPNLCDLQKLQVILFFFVLK